MSVAEQAQRRTCVQDGRMINDRHALDFFLLVWLC